MPREEKVKISNKNFTVLVIAETPRDWRCWKAFNRVVGRQDDLALKIYAVLYEKGVKTSSRDLASTVDAPLYSVRRALRDLYELEIVSRERLERGHLTFDYWSIKKHVLGVLRLIPEQYFQKGYPIQ